MLDLTRKSGCWPLGEGFVPRLPVIYARSALAITLGEARLQFGEIGKIFGANVCETGF